MSDTHARVATRDAGWIQNVLIGGAVLVMVLVLIWPLGIVFSQAFSKGFGHYVGALREQDTLAALDLTMLAAVVAVPLNLVFGVAAAWVIARFNFRGKRALVALIDLPLAVSPVVAGMMFVMLCGANSVLGSWLGEHGIKVIFAPLGVIVATTFVTVPFVARELMAVMQQQDPAQEWAALTLGATGWQMFWRVTLPRVRWGLVYGGILCGARAVGEFGAVSVVSGHIRGETNTASLQVEILYNEYRFAEAFAVSTLLVLLALATLVIKHWIMWRAQRLAESNVGVVKGGVK